jgi:hypothetical protein
MPIPSYDDFFEMGLRSVRIRPSKFTAEMAEQEESTANTVMNVAASMMDETAVFLDTSISENAFGPAMRMGGTVLDRFALDRYGDDFEPRKGASNAVAVLSFRRNGTEGCAVPRNSRVATEGGLIFRTNQDLVFAPNVKGPLTVFATCTTAGPDGNVIAGKIKQLLDKPDEDATMAATNTLRASGGAPAEDEGPFGGRIRGYWRAARKGTKAAVQYECETTDGISEATVEEMLQPFGGKPDYRALVYVADESGSANAALAQRVQARLPEARGLGVPVLVTRRCPCRGRRRRLGHRLRRGDPDLRAARADPGQHRRHRQRAQAGRVAPGRGDPGRDRALRPDRQGARQRGPGADRRPHHGAAPLLAQDPQRPRHGQRAVKRANLREAYRWNGGGFKFARASSPRRLSPPSALLTSRSRARPRSPAANRAAAEREAHPRKTAGANIHAPALVVMTTEIGAVGAGRSRGSTRGPASGPPPDAALGLRAVVPDALSRSRRITLAG